MSSCSPSKRVDIWGMHDIGIAVGRVDIRLLLLGEGRYLAVPAPNAFPERKNAFCSQAARKTAAPRAFGALLSRRRR